MMAATTSASQRKIGSTTPLVMPSFRLLDCAGSTVRASVNDWAPFTSRLVSFIAKSLTGKHTSGSSQSQEKGFGNLLRGKLAA